MGAIALFSDKYGDQVRVVSIGDFSIEFCGGTHVKNTNELGLFKITSETGIGAGTRRIEAVTAGDAFAYLNDHDQILTTAAASLKSQKVAEVPTKIQQLQEQIKVLNTKAESLEAKLAGQQAGAIFDNVQTVNGKQLITGVVQVSSMDQLRQLADTWRQKSLSDVLVLGAEVGEKANLIVAASDDAIKAGVKAGDLIKAISPKINGGGGGRPNLAQAGGKNPAGLQAAMDEAAKWLSNLD